MQIFVLVNIVGIGTLNLRVIFRLNLCMLNYAPDFTLLALVVHPRVVG